jgi:hypothetical protein
VHCRVNLRVLTCVANDLPVWKHSLVAHAGVTFTIWKDRFCAVLILRHCWGRHTRLGCCHCCGWTRIGRRSITTSVRERGTNYLTMTLEGGNLRVKYILNLSSVSLLKHFEGCSILIVTDAGALPPTASLRTSSWRSTGGISISLEEAS